MKSKKISRFLWGEAAVCAFISGLLYSLTDIKEAYQFLNVPFEVMGAVLRKMSLFSGLGNIIAFLLYMLISLLPILIYIPTIIRKRKVQWDGIMLTLLSAYLFFILYCFINPERVPEVFHKGGDGSSIEKIGKTTLSMLFYIGVVGCSMMGCLKTIKNSGQNEKTLVRHLQRLLSFFAYGFTAVVTVQESMVFMELLTRKVAEGKEITKFYYSVIEVLNLVPSVFLMFVLVKAIALLNQLGKEQYSEETVETAKALARAGQLTVCMTLFSCISVNLLQLILANTLSKVSFTLTLPVLSLVIAYASMLLANYFKTSNQLYEDKQMII